MVPRVSFGGGFQLVKIIKPPKPDAELSALQYFFKCPKVVIYLLPDPGKVGWAGHVKPPSNKALVARLDVQVVARLLYHFAARGKARAHIGFVRAFVLAEPHIAIDVKRQFFGVEPHKPFVKGHQLVKQFFQEHVKGLL